MPTVDVDGAKLGYEERGAGPAVLLIHGTGGNVWGALPEMLGTDHRVVAYDRRGFGESAHDPSKDPPRHTADAAALIEALGAAPAVVVGHSMGGVIGLHLAALHPDLVRALVVVEPPLHLRKHPTFKMMRELIPAQVVRRTRGDEAAAVRFMRWATSMSDGRNGYDLTPPEDQARLRANSAAIMCELDGGTGEHVTNEQIAGIGCPVVALVGDITLPEYASAVQRIVKTRPATEVIEVPGAGHILPVTHPQFVVDAVRRAERAVGPASTA